MIVGTQDRPSVGRGDPTQVCTMANRRAKGKRGQEQLEIQGPSADMTDHSKNLYFDGFTKDWALIELYNDKIDWGTFKGSQVYIGTSFFIALSISSSSSIFFLTLIAFSIFCLLGFGFN